MSLQKDGRTFRHSGGRTFPATPFAAAVAAALHREFDDNGGGIAKVCQLTGANERTVRNWFEGKNGPGGEYLVMLCRHSDGVLETVLTLAGRTSHIGAARLERLLRKLVEIRELLVDVEVD